MNSLLGNTQSETIRKPKHGSKTKRTKSDTRRTKTLRSERLGGHTIAQDQESSTIQESDRGKKKMSKKSTDRVMMSTRVRKHGETSEMQQLSTRTHIDQLHVSTPQPSTPQTSTPLATSREKSNSEKWAGRDVARTFLDRIDTMVARSEFIELKNIQPDLNKCKKWRKNQAKNQSEQYACFDHNIVKHPQNSEEYVNASSINLSNISKPIIIGQIPKKENFEEFWKIIFEANVMLMYVLIGADEIADFFPREVGAYEHFGSMWVNNRKVEKVDNECYRYNVEVLPQGCSNSNQMTIVLQIDWQSQNVPAKFGKTIKSVIEVTSFIPSAPGEDKCMIISKHGAGRAGFFISLCSAISTLNNKHEPKLVEIVKKVREQRPGAVESFKQYTSLYLCLVYYIKKKLNDPKLQQKTVQINEAFKLLLEGAGQSVMQ
ncbi:unnamed protein product [Caenorhabditis angaria]|uniref:Tyrosine-protein phosphatase domain-containing protein n=1 Tax=Caenorhabditis angaria TaxID=860376 RepID=A0A9P1IQ47_9PELO|nr:unnamed protein product [Caenorhabditis angaria]